MKKKKKKKSISYHTSFCVQTGHQKSRIGWGKLSRFSFKSTANKNNFSFLVKKS
jgi:ribosomal protein S14